MGYQLVLRIAAEDYIPHLCGRHLYGLNLEDIAMLDEGIHAPAVGPDAQGIATAKHLSGESRQISSS
jgi:hypothetical protein